ncbi:MAG: FMN-binding protein [Phycisphaerae bacterium]|nr:FMN-binding protein [Phycisphaerae bacterium]
MLVSLLAGSLSAETASTTQPASREREQMDAIAARVAASQPDWWDSVKLDIPKTLDLTWPDRPADWSKSIDMYIFRTYDHRPARHREACKFLTAIVTTNPDNPRAQYKASLRLGQYYGLLLHDYARGAYWYRRAARHGPLFAFHQTNLAYCYWKLGSKELALAELGNVRNIQTARLLGEIGEIDKVKSLTDAMGDFGAVVMGDTYRYHGRFKEALESYNRVTTRPGQVVFGRNFGRAGAEAIPSFEAAAAGKFTDGTYTGESAGFRGPIKVEATIKGGRIATVKVVSSRDDWPLSAQVMIPAEIVEKQSVHNVDTVTGATYTSAGVINAAAKAVGSSAK